MRERRRGRRVNLERADKKAFVAVVVNVVADSVFVVFSVEAAPPVPSFQRSLSSGHHWHLTNIGDYEGWQE